MMLGPAITAIRARMLAGITDWPVRWMNELFMAEHQTPNGLPLTEHDGEYRATAFVEAEVIGGRNEIRGVGTQGNRLWIHDGIIRAYVATPSGTGTSAADAKADEIAAMFERVEIATATENEPVRCGDASINGGIANYEEGNYFVLMVSIPFQYFYHG